MDGKIKINGRAILALFKTFYLRHSFSLSLSLYLSFLFFPSIPLYLVSPCSGQALHPYHAELRLRHLKIRTIDFYRCNPGLGRADGTRWGFEKGGGDREKERESRGKGRRRGWGKGFGMGKHPVKRATFARFITTICIRPVLLPVKRLPVPPHRDFNGPINATGGDQPQEISAPLHFRPVNVLINTRVRK